MNLAYGECAEQSVRADTYERGVFRTVSLYFVLG
jgi:hypothetical protein